MQFGSLLKEYIKKQNLTIYQLAKDTGIDRSFLQGVLNGKRKMPRKRFADVVNIEYFTTSQIHKLCETYFLEQYGAEKIKLFECIENGIKGKVKEELNKKYECEPVKINNGTSYHSGKKDILAVVYTIMNENCISDFISNYSFKNREINRIVFNACKERRIKNFFHYVTPESKNSVYNIEIIFNMLHFAQEGYITYTSEERPSSYILPQFIVTDKHTLLFDETVENAVLFETDIIKPLLKQKSDEIKNKCKTIVNITENAFDYMYKTNTITANTISHNLVGFDNQVCPSFITPEIIEAIATPAVKNIPSVIQQLISHYKLTAGGESEQVIIGFLTVTYGAIASFVKDGYLCGFPRELANPVPKEMRSHFLKCLIDKNKVDKLFIVNPNILSTNLDINFQLNDRYLIIVLSQETNLPDDYNGKILMHTDNEALVTDFKDYLDYLSLSEKTYSQNASRDILNAFIEQLEAD